MRQIIRSSRTTKTAVRQNLSAIVAAVVMLFSTAAYASADIDNLIPNPGLETPNTAGTAPADWQSDSWADAGATVTPTFQYLDEGHESNHSVKVTMNAYQCETGVTLCGDAKWYFTDVNVTPGTEYYFKDTYKSTTASTITIQYTMTDTTNSYEDLVSSLPAAADWTSYSNTFVAPANAKTATIFHLLNTAGELTIDDLSLQAMTPATVVDYVPNPSMEVVSLVDSGLPLGWSRQGWTTLGNNPVYEYLDDGHDGGHSVKVTMKDWKDGDAKWMYDPQPVGNLDGELHPGQDYEFTAWYKTNTVPHVVVQFQYSDPNKITYFGMPNPELNDGQWHKYHDEFSVPFDATSATIFMYLAGNPGIDGQDPYVQSDDYRITPFSYEGHNFNRPLVTLTFDDGSEENVFTALPVIDQYGFKTTQCYMSEPLENGNADGEDQITDMLDFAKAGHEICSHTVTHPFLSQIPLGDPTVDPESQVGTATYELFHSGNYLRQQLSAEADRLATENPALSAQLRNQIVQNFASPYGDYDAAVNDVIKKYYSSHRTVNEGYNSKYDLVDDQGNLDLYHLRVQNMEKGTTLAEFQGWIDKAIQDKTWLILVYHRIPCVNKTTAPGCETLPPDQIYPIEEFDTAKADFDPQMALLNSYVQANQITVKTMEDAISEVTAQMDLDVPPSKPASPTSAPSTDSSYESSVAVSLLADPAAEIYYTVDGTEPACSTSTVYAGPFTLTATTIVKAIACVDGAASDAVSFPYTVTQPTGPTPVLPSKPTATPIAGVYDTQIQVVLNSENYNFIKYTLDGTEPTCVVGTNYAPIDLSANNTTTVVKAVACNSDGASEVATFTYTVAMPHVPVYPQLPTADPGSNTYTSSQNVALSSANSTSIRYTVDGTVPTCDTGLVYSGPVAVSHNLTLQAIGCNADGASAVATFAYAFRTSSGNSGSHTGGGGGGGNGGSVAGASTDVHPNGTLIISNGTVYLIKDGKRFGFRDAAEYQSYGYNFSQVVPATSADLQLSFDSANIMKAMPGTLVLDASDNKTVYMIGTGYTKRGFVSASVFAGLGYNFKNLPKINLIDYPAGAPIGSAAQAHPDGALVLDHGTVWWILGNARQGFESAAVFNTYGFDWNKIVKANSADMALSAGPLVKFRDGTLVLDGGVNYIISDGQARAFAPASVMTAKGYSASNVISASLANYAKGADIK